MKALHRRPIKTRIYALIALEFLFGVVYGVFSLALPILAESILLNLVVLGFVFSLPEILGTLIDVPIGGFAKRFGRRRTVFYSGMMLAFSSFLFMFSRNPFIFVGVLIFYEIATQSFIIPGDAEETALTPARSTGRFNALLGGFHNLGFSIGPIATGMIIGYQFEYAFWLTLVISIAMMIVSFIFLPKEEKHEEFWKASVHLVTRDKIFKSGFSEFAALGFEGVFIAFIFFVFALHWGFIAIGEPLFTKSLGFNEFQIGLIYAGFTLPIFFVSFIVGRYLDRRSAKGIAVAGLLLHAFSSFGFSLTVDPMLLFILSLVSGVGDALILPAIFTMFDRLSSYHKKEHVSGIKMFGESLGYFVGPILGGVLAGFVGFASAFFIMGLFLLGLTFFVGVVPIRVARPM